MTNRYMLFVTIAVLALIVAIVGYKYYQDRQKTSGIEINIGKTGITVETE